MTAAPGPHPDAGALVSQQQGDGLILRAHGRRRPAAPDSRLDLTDGSVKLRDDVAVAADASLLLCIGIGRAVPALACSSQKLLLWDAGHCDHGSMPRSPADWTRNVPAKGLMLRTPRLPADLRRSTQPAAGVLCGPGAAGGWASNHHTESRRRTASSVPGSSFTTTRTRAHNSRAVAR